MSASDVDWRGERGVYVDPLPEKGFEDFDVGNTVPVPEYLGKMNWIFPGGTTAAVGNGGGGE